MKVALVFPGQGSQFIGMGKDLFDNYAEAREIFEEINDTLKQKLSDLIFSGDLEVLTLTENTQPALMAVSMAIINILEKQAKINIASKCKYLFGHSLGEYSALTAAKSFSVSQSAKLLKLRGKSMQEAAPKGTSGMVALLGTDIYTAEEIVKLAKGDTDEICQIANDNASGQIVISGHLSALDRAINYAINKGLKAIKLSVSAAFHSELMMPAQQIMEEALNKETINKPIIPIIANVSANVVSDPEEIKKLLAKQVSGRVRFRESVIRSKELGVTKVYEIGAGKVLSGLIKRIDPEISAIPIQNTKDLEIIIKDLG